MALKSTLPFPHNFCTIVAIQHRINEKIRAEKLRVIDENGKNLGVISREEALRLVRPGIDLVEITANANPPVAKLMNFDKYRYELAKAEKKERQGQKTAGMKQVQISGRAQSHDLQVKAKQAEEFLSEGRVVEISMRLRGREKGNKEWAKGKLQEFLQMLPEGYKVLQPPKFGGRGMIAQISRHNAQKLQ